MAIKTPMKKNFRAEAWQEDKRYMMNERGVKKSMHEADP
jgi:hypothetical protein